MSRFTGRIRKLKLQTHTFISNRELQTLRDGLKAELDTNGVTPAEFEEEYGHLITLFDASNQRASDETVAEIRKIIERNRFAFIAFLYQHAVEMCESCPEGTWTPKGSKNYVTPLLIREAMGVT